MNPIAARPLEGKVALLTGSSHGIGLAIGQRFADADASVMLSSRKAAVLEAARARVEGDAAWCVANAGEPADAALAEATTIERFGSLDPVVNNAAPTPARVRPSRSTSTATTRPGRSICAARSRSPVALEATVHTARRR